jgi:hypothetical protein
MAVKSFDELLPFFLDRKERPKEAPFMALEKMGAAQELVAHSWNSSYSIKSILKNRNLSKGKESSFNEC